jgi:hypothetical protein
MKAKQDRLYLLLLGSIGSVFNAENLVLYDKTIESSVKFYNEVNNANLTIQRYCEYHNIKKCFDKHYNFVFGFSSGHVGTKSLNFAKLYRLEPTSPNVHVRFGFEGTHVSIHTTLYSAYILLTVQ